MENSMKLKIVFLGTGEFGDIVLQELGRANYRVVSRQFKDIKKIKPDLLIVANFGKIIPENILKFPGYGCLNVHPSLLPKYRGASPVQSAILNGDKETGVSIILMDEQIDHGPILTQKKTVIGPDETADQLCHRLALLGSELLIDVIPNWIRGEKQLIAQDEEKATYTRILTRKDGAIDWSKPAQKIERQIRAFQPWPGTYTFYNGKRLKILKARLEKDKLIIKEVQPEGKKQMSFADFLLGHKDFRMPC
jgi:methionyl-tRNA formyltransferase